MQDLPRLQKDMSGSMGPYYRRKNGLVLDLFQSNGGSMELAKGNRSQNNRRMQKHGGFYLGSITPSCSGSEA